MKSRSIAHLISVTVLILFSIAPSRSLAETEKQLTSFIEFPRGASSQASLIMDDGGNLYGTTLYGGKYGYGTVFELTSDANGRWNESVLYDFSGGLDGGLPAASLIFDSVGNLYGTTEAGGLSGDCYFAGVQTCGVVFELSLSKGVWQETVLYSFTGYPNDGSNPTDSLTLDSAGDLYGTTQRGGAYDEGTVFEITSGGNGSWSEVILHEFSGEADGGFPYAGVLFGADGNLYGTTFEGGDLNCSDENNNRGCGVVYRLTNSGNNNWNESVIHPFTFNDGAYPESNLILDPAGNLYGTTLSGPGFACNQGCGTIFRLTPNQNGSWAQSIIYNFEGVLDGANPVSGLTLDSSGNLYGTTPEGGGCYERCGTIFKLSSSAGGKWSETVLYRFGLTKIADSVGNAPKASLLIDSQGNLFGTAAGGGSFAGACSSYANPGGCGTVFKLTQGDDHQSTLSLVYAFPAGAMGLAPAGGLVFDSSGNLYGATSAGGLGNCYSGDGANGCGTIFELQPQASGGWRTTVIHTFNGLSEGADPTGSLVTDSLGNLYGTLSDGGSVGCIGYESPCGGAVFELSPGSNGWTAMVLHTFHARGNDLQSDGALPMSGLIMDTAGNLYGTTFLGGYEGQNCREDMYLGCGTVYKLSPQGNGAWKEELLYSFKGGSDGDAPYGALTFDGTGALYGTTSLGGVNGDGTVFKLTPGSNGSWTESILYSFQGEKTGDGSFPYAGVIFDEEGNLYGTTLAGGYYSDNCAYTGCGIVFELLPSGGSWKEDVVLAFHGNDGSNPKGPLSLDSEGNLYGSAPYNEANYSFAAGVVFELSPGSHHGMQRVLHHFGHGFDGSSPNGGLIFDSVGNIYGTTSEGGLDGSGTVFELTSGSGDEAVDSFTGPPRITPNAIHSATANPFKKRSDFLTSLLKGISNEKQ